MKISRLKTKFFAAVFAACLLTTTFMFFAQAAATVIDDVLADGNSTNQDLPNNSLAIYTARNQRVDAVGSMTINVASTSSDAYWAHFTNAGAPVTLGIGDSIKFTSVLSLTYTTSSGGIRFGLLDTKATRLTTNQTGGLNDSAFGNDTGYAADIYPNTSGLFATLYRRDVTSPTTNNIFNSLATSAGIFPITGTGSPATRQSFVSGSDYTLTYSVTRLTATDTQISVRAVGQGVDETHTGTETSNNPYTTFDEFILRIGGSAIASSIKFKEFKIEYSPAAPVITTQPSPASQTVAAGSNNVQIAVAATGNGLSYQWRRNGTPITGNATAATATLILNNVLPADAGDYTVVVSNAGGSVTSQISTLIVTTGPVDPAPVTNQQPQNTTAIIGSPASLSVTASGLNLNYQWFKNGNLISGATNPTLSFAAVQPSDTADYTVNVSNSGGTITSDPARLTVVSAIAATAFSPTNNLSGICADTTLAVTFNQTPKIGTSGAIKIYRADGTLIETIDTANAAPTRIIGTNATAYRYYPIIINGNTAAIYPKQTFAYNQTYYVTIDTGALTDTNNLPFAGFSNSSTFRFTTKTAAPTVGTTNLTVAADNSGDFCTVQGAIDFVPAGNTQRRNITVKNGTYTEIVYLGAAKPLVTIRGESRTQTIVQYANNNTLNGFITGNNRASFGVDATDFNLENITLRNTTPQNGSQAETLRTNGGRTTVNSVNFYSYQDTVLTQKSAYIANSYIEGDVDFTWGNGATYYVNSELKSLRDGGYYSQIRNPATNYGNVYVNCRLTKGAGVSINNYLGRIDPDDDGPNGFPYSQVVLIDTKMDSHIAPMGWLFTTASLPVNSTNYPNIRYWEYNSTALDGTTPIDCSQRHPISRNACNNPLTQAEVDFYRNPANVTGFTPQEKLTAIVSLTNLTQTYDGTPKPATITTDPNGLMIDFTYNGSPTAPTNAGTYTVVATVNDANYQGSATGTLTITRAAAAITLGNLTQIYDGTPKAVSITTNPANIAATVTYNGSTNVPTAIGNYTVVANVSDPNYSGTATANLNIRSTIKAFAGAEGAGEYAVGGRGGDVYHVTNLNDSGAGSLRNGITSATGARTIVFDLSGTIYLNTDLRINKPFITIAGQTAPGDGITVAGRTTMVDQTQHIIIRYMRFRGGDINCPSMQGDSFWVDKSKDVIVDHISTSWSVDETLSVTESDRVTVQWAFITESLNNSCHYNDEGTAFERHGYGSLIRYGDGRISYHHNLYAHHFNRNPRVGDNITLDFVNNVIFDWGTDASYSGGASEGTTKVNYIGNYLVAGPNTGSTKRNRAFSGGSINTLIYQTGNFIDGNLNGIRDGANTGWAMFVGAYTQANAPLDFSGKSSVNNLVDINADDAATAYNRVLNTAGQSRQRDAVDTRIASEVGNETGLFIDSQTQVGGFPTLASQSAPTDTDGDGIPDFWESSNGLNPNDPNDAAAIAANGYTNLENYLSSSFAPTAAAANIGGRILTASGRGVSKARVTITDAASGAPKTVLTNPFGYYNFYNLPTARTYIISVADKRYEFSIPSTVVSLSSEVAGLNFTAEN